MNQTWKYDFQARFLFEIRLPNIKTHIHYNIILKNMSYGFNILIIEVFTALLSIDIRVHTSTLIIAIY